MKIKVLIILLFLIPLCKVNAQENLLKNQINTYLVDKQALVGVAVYNFKTKETILINEQEHYPMQSVYKFHLALAVLNQVDKKKFKLNDKVLIKKEDLRPNTWSPMRKKYPEGNISLSLSEIIDYSVAKSDNNACDILFKFLGGTKVVHKFIKSLGIKDISIKATEEEMHQDWETQFTNWTSPVATLELLKKFHKKEILSPKTQKFLWKTMISSYTGTDKIKADLPSNTPVAHKSGRSMKSDEGIIAADNDIAIVQLPNGDYFALVVFVSDSKETYKANAKIIADISLITWKYFLGK